MHVPLTRQACQLNAASLSRETSPYPAPFFGNGSEAPPVKGIARDKPLNPIFKTLDRSGSGGWFLAFFQVSDKINHPKNEISAFRTTSML